MRVRDHIVISTALAAALYPVLRRRVVAPWAASILLDADHYLWHAAHARTLDPRAAMRFFNQAQPPRHAATRWLHTPQALLLLILVGLRWPLAIRAALGVALHIQLDLYHEWRTDRIRAAVLRRDRAICQWCGARGPDVVAHCWRQPLILPSYRPAHFISLCAACHEAAHRVHSPQSAGYMIHTVASRSSTHHVRRAE